MLKKREKSKRKSTYSATVFDDVYRTITQKLPKLMIPLINEVFGTEYDPEDRLEQLRNEHLEVEGKLITDSIFSIGGHKYHIECQSGYDGRMTLRMYRYDMAIALESADTGGEGISIRYPESCVLYVREHKKIPKFHEASIRFPDGQEIRYRIPVIKVSDFGIEEIFEKKLIMFLPYYILRYEDLIREKRDKEGLEKVYEEYRHITEELRRYCDRGEGHIYPDIIKFMEYICDYVSRDDKDIRERLGEIMGGNILKLRSEELYEQGEARGKQISAINLYRRGMSAEDIAEIIECPVSEVQSWIEEKL